jgi:F-type H+-transporting ATPase subunit delta
VSDAAASYARALFELATTEDQVRRVETDLETVTDTVKGHLKLKEILGDAAFPADKKREVIRQVFEADLSPLTLGVLTMLVDAGRDGELATVAAAYAEIAEAGTGAVTAKVTTAVPLTNELRAELVAKLATMSGTDVELREMVDPSVLGGVVVEIGGRVLDGSVRARLAEMKSQLSVAAPSAAKEGEE